MKKLIVLMLCISFSAQAMFLRGLLTAPQKHIGKNRLNRAYITKIIFSGISEPQRKNFDNPEQFLCAYRKWIKRETNSRLGHWDDNKAKKAIREKNEKIAAYERLPKCNLCSFRHEPYDYEHDCNTGLCNKKR